MLIIFHPRAVPIDLGVTVSHSRRSTSRLPLAIKLERELGSVIKKWGCATEKIERGIDSIVAVTVCERKGAENFIAKPPQKETHSSLRMLSKKKETDIFIFLLYYLRQYQKGGVVVQVDPCKELWTI
ncbi:hypothetical protein TNCT_615751 [Trichonephila clavata]|uniref:Uncharacterized protein n=1 Tax=Trichonephila clavata TaxID=2740835 RepID=A0A8X6G8U4_TRICU|nr:hypothetical protein TNCT_615751 [Trichonephila clavata]